MDESENLAKECKSGGTSIGLEPASNGHRGADSSSDILIAVKTSLKANYGNSNLKANATAITLRMEGGEGDGSYTRNSTMQAHATVHLHPILGDAIRQLNERLPRESSIRVADLGCSVGANTLSYASYIVRSLQEKYASQSIPAPEVQMFFSDLPSNDFNTLFQQLPVSRRMTSNETDQETAYFAAGVPGSFYHSIFPCASLHIVVSTFSLMWMSEVPHEVRDKSSPAYNRGRAWIDGERPAVAEAFAQVARKDLRNFLRNRAREIVPGGLLFFFLLARKDSEHPENQLDDDMRFTHPYGRDLEDTWEEFVSEGLIDADTRDGFNVPIFCRSLNEVREAISETSAFHIKRLELWQDFPYFPGDEDKKLIANPEAYGQFTKSFTKSLLNPLVQAHIGIDLASKLFERIGQRAAERARSKSIRKLGLTYILAVLVRK